MSSLLTGEQQLATSAGRKQISTQFDSVPQATILDRIADVQFVMFMRPITIDVASIAAWSVCWADRVWCKKAQPIMSQFGNAERVTDSCELKKPCIKFRWGLDPRQWARRGLLHFVKLLRSGHL